MADAADLFDDPGTTDKLDFNELLGELVLISPSKVEIGIKTVHGPKDATIATVHVIEAAEPKVYVDSPVWPGVVQGQLRSIVGTGRYVLGRVEQGNAKPGQNPPWKLAKPTDKDKIKARKYLDGLNGHTIADPDDDIPPWEQKKR
jgi:hypothetical protein